MCSACAQPVQPDADAVRPIPPRAVGRQDDEGDRGAGEGRARRDAHRDGLGRGERRARGLIPMAARIAISHSTDPAATALADAVPTTDKPTRSARRRPNRSASTPAATNNPANTTTYASTTACRAAVPAACARSPSDWGSTPRRSTGTFRPATTCSTWPSTPCSPSCRCPSSPPTTTGPTTGPTSGPTASVPTCTACGRRCCATRGRGALASRPSAARARSARSLRIRLLRARRRRVHRCGARRRRRRDQQPRHRLPGRRGRMAARPGSPRSTSDARAPAAFRRPLPHPRRSRRHVRQQLGGPVRAAWTC
jgi:hypothetical protein